jgi:hypothetical protein
VGEETLDGDDRVVIIGGGGKPRVLCGASAGGGGDGESLRASSVFASREETATSGPDGAKAVWLSLAGEGSI